MDLCSENNTIQSVVIKALSLLPYTELLNVACVCKSWCKLRTSKGFRDARKAVDEHALVVTNWTDDATYLSVYALCGDRWYKMAVNHAQAYGRSSRPLLVIGAATSFRGELFELAETPPLALARGVWTELPPIPQRWPQATRWIWEKYHEKEFGPWTPGMTLPEGHFEYNPSACRDPFLASLPMPL